jgi:bis(5'-nucleosyl)-tetraphosphatase (symmetrical)
MALYAIGDVQGCDEQLGELLGELKFSPDKDRLWLVGDLVNRGPDSLKVLRRVRALGAAANTVLGNHDLHLLAVGFGKAKLKSGDTLQPILDAPDRTALLEWMAGLPLLHEDPALNLALVHAGLAPQWDMELARQCAREVEKVLRRSPEKLFDKLYGDEPNLWDKNLSGEDRLRFIVNCYTRLRYVDDEGRIELSAKGSPKKMQSRSLIPWFESADAHWHGPRIIFGHWSTLGFFRDSHVTSLDTGCVWGDRLTALRLDDPQAKPVQVGCQKP